MMIRSRALPAVLAVLGGTLLLAAAPASAAGMMAGGSNTMASGKTVHVRGTVKSIDGTTVSVKAREGGTVPVTLGSDWQISGVKSAAIGDIKQGDFVGIASIPAKKGTSSAVEVVIFPASMKGTGEGNYAWDLKPGSSMTNATVANTVKKVDGPTLTLNYNGGKEKKITIPKSTPIVTFASATKDDLKPGMAVFVAGTKNAGGKIVASRVVVGNHGIVPPM